MTQEQFKHIQEIQKKIDDERDEIERLKIGVGVGQKDRDINIYPFAHTTTSKLRISNS